MLDDPRGNAHGGRPRRYVSQNYRVGADLGVLSDPQLPDDLGAGAYVDVAFESRYTARRLPDRDLVKQKTIRANLSIGMNHDAVRMRQEQAAAQIAIQRNIGASNQRPPAMSEHCEPAQPSGTYPSRIEQTLIVANARQKGARWRPFESRFLLSRPVRDVGGHCRTPGIVAVVGPQKCWIIDARDIHPAKDMVVH